MATRVLVVDDDKNLQVLLGVLLKRDGFEADFAHDGGDGLQKMQKADYDVIVMDLFLPVLSGLELLQNIELERPHLLERVIVLSGAPLKQLAKAHGFGVHDVVRKPFDIGELMTIVKTCENKICTP